MVSSNAVVLCTYSYDPLDRLAGASPGGSDSVQRFYQKSRLATEIQGEIHRALFQTEGHLLAQQQHQSGKTNCALFGTDRQRSVLHGLDATQRQAFAYTAYGFHQPQLHLPGFNGEQPDPVTGHYLLGNGYRAFNPVLMRFNSPDSLSPFGKGGLNAYAYCVGDPVNRVDPTGHWGVRHLVSLLKGKSIFKTAVKTSLKTKHPITGDTDWAFERALRHVASNGTPSSLPGSSRASLSSVDELASVSNAPPLPPRFDGSRALGTERTLSANNEYSYAYARALKARGRTTSGHKIIKQSTRPSVETPLTNWPSVLGERPHLFTIAEDPGAELTRTKDFLRTVENGKRVLRS